MRQIINEKGPTVKGTHAIKRVQAQIHEIRNPQTTYNTGAAQDVRMFEQSDNCTRRFFSTYKATSKQNWINEMKTALWQEDVTPIFTDKTKTVGSGGRRRPAGDNTCVRGMGQLDYDLHHAPSP